jgi:hypothetical protein
MKLYHAYYCEIYHKDKIKYMFIFVCFLLLFLNGCTSIEKTFNAKPSNVEKTTQEKKGEKGKKPSEVLAALLAEKSPDHLIPVQKKTIPPLPALPLSTPPLPTPPLPTPRTNAKSTPQTGFTKTTSKKIAPPKKSAILPVNSPLEEKKVTVATPASTDIPTTLNDLMQAMPKGKMVFAAPQTPATPIQTAPTNTQQQTPPLPVASTPPVNPQTADPIDTMAAEIMHASPSAAAVVKPTLASETNPVIVENTARPTQKNTKKKGVFIPLSSHETLKLSPADMEKLVSSNTDAVLSDATSVLDNGSLLSRVKNRAFNHGVILEDKPVLVPAKPIAGF